MQLVHRIYVEKKAELAHEAKALLGDARTLLGIKNLTDVRVINRYDAEDIEKDLFDYAVKNNRKLVSVVTKANICKLSDGLFLECAREISKKYPSLSYAQCLWGFTYLFMFQAKKCNLQNSRNRHAISRACNIPCSPP